MGTLLIAVLMATVAVSTANNYKYCKGSTKALWLVPPVMTPLNEDKSINYDVIPSYAQFLVKNGIKSAMVSGSTGEGPSRSVEERKKLIDVWVRVGKRLGMYIVAHVGGTTYKDVATLARYASTAGVDAISTLPELYYKPETVEDLVFYVGLVAKNAPNLPVLYYHFPNQTNVDIDMAQFIPEATAKIPNFSGVKFADVDLSAAARALRTLRKDQELFYAIDTLLAPAALLGVRASIAAYINVFPRLVQAIFKAVDECNVEEARQLQEKLSLANEAIGNLPGLKYAMEIVNGIKVGPPSLPQRPISNADKKRIEYALRRLGLLQDYNYKMY